MIYLKMLQIFNINLKGNIIGLKTQDEICTVDEKKKKNKYTYTFEMYHEKDGI